MASSRPASPADGVVHDTPQRRRFGPGSLQVAELLEHAALAFGEIRGGSGAPSLTRRVQGVQQPQQLARRLRLLAAAVARFAAAVVAQQRQLLGPPAVSASRIPDRRSRRSRGRFPPARRRWRSPPPAGAPRASRWTGLPCRSCRRRRACSGTCRSAVTCRRGSSTGPEPSAASYTTDSPQRASMDGLVGRS